MCIKWYVYESLSTMLMTFATVQKLVLYLVPEFMEFVAYVTSARVVLPLYGDEILFISSICDVRGMKMC